MRDRDRSPSRALLVLLLLAAFAVITLDAKDRADSPLNPVRAAVGEVVGPVERAAAAVVRPFTAVPEALRTIGSLREEVRRLEAENAELRGQVATSEVDRNRAAELDGLLRTASDTGYAVVPARVVGIGPAQAFNATVTVDAGTRSGIRPDMTVVNHAGLVGRVLRADRTTATVLLVVDSGSVVGGRLGSSMELGFVSGGGSVGRDGTLSMALVDQTASPDRGDVVVTWGSQRGAPYVAGIPIGTVTEVESSPRQLSKRATVVPFVDFSSLDLVGVVGPAGTEGDRPVLTAERGR